MSGLSEIGQLPGFATGGAQVAARDIDRYDQYIVWAPSVDTAYIGTVSSATANAAFVTKNAYPDYPRNLAYSVTGVAGGMGGTFTLSGQDQFGGTVRESVTIGSAAGGGTTQGTAIFAKIAGGTFSPAGLGGTAVGTAAIGFGTAPGTAGTAGNYFGLPVKLGGTADVKRIVWITTNTPTTLNAGTSIGSLVSVSLNAFCGTSGVAITDRYVVTIKSTFDNAGKAPTAGL
jgi:hypothetical protein